MKSLYIGCGKKSMVKGVSTCSFFLLTSFCFGWLFSTIFLTTVQSGVVETFPRFILCMVNFYGWPSTTTRLQQKQTSKSSWKWRPISNTKIFYGTKKHKLQDCLPAPLLQAANQTYNVSGVSMKFQIKMEKAMFRWTAVCWISASYICISIHRNTYINCILYMQYMYIDVM